MVEAVFQDQTFIGMGNRGWLSRLVNSGIGDDDESGCDVEAMIHCPDEK